MAPRSRYPSDESRLKNRPHVKVHLTVATHPKMAALWADPRWRGMLVELWRIAGESFAGRRGDVVILSPAAVLSITGMERQSYAMQALRELCRLAEYPVSCRCAGGADPVSTRCRCSAVSVHVRNFSKKQGWHSADSGATPPTPPPSESDSESSLLKTEESARRSPLLNLLTRLPGSPAEKELWLAETLPQIEVDSAESRKTRKPWSVASGVVRYYRAYLERCQRQKLDPRPFEQQARDQSAVSAYRARRAAREAAGTFESGPPPPTTDASLLSLLDPVPAKGGRR